MSEVVQGVITKGVGGAYSVCIDGGKTRAACQIRGGLRLGSIVPQAGDRVTIEPSGDPDLPYVITKILPRKNNLVRPPVANVDYLILTFSVTDPEPDLKLLDKLLIICANLDITPLIVFTKEDLGKEAAAKYLDEYSACGYQVLVSSKDSPVTAEALESITGSGIAAFAGPSGVGKSTLCNRIIGKEHMEVGTISRKLKRGRHTTRHVELFDFGEGFITDTPGFTSLSLLQLGIGYKEVPAGYPEIYKFTGKCKYDDCRHIKEEGCVVREALSLGQIGEERYNRYREFSEELYNERNNYKRRKA
ncbi:MAG: ribosome small subunit-dependent GTPase A [Clostridiales bacterium]|nr:ribosome small subunit-dependent GTPase A [Clostridiales bacterium]MBQ5423136.1 ribosome small subunit-dependent GTPase A [Clostridiales bacterium]